MVDGTPEQRVVRQLVEALLFEGLVEYVISPRTKTGSGEPIYDSHVEFRIASEHYSCLATVAAFGRFRVSTGSVHRRVGHKLIEATVVELVSALSMIASAKQRLLEELTQTAELCRWNFENLPHQHEPRRRRTWQELESMIVEGHLYHPSFKSRTGFSLADHRRYGPEVGSRFQLQWLAIDRSRIRAVLPGEESAFWRRELSPREYSRLTTCLASYGRAWTTHALVPIHPWQLENVRGRLEAALARGEILELGEGGDMYHASQSLRTLINASEARKPNVKLPLNVVCTSTHRNLRPAFVCTAPRLSDWLVTLVAQDPFFRAHPRMVLLREYAGILYEPLSGGGGRETASSGQALVGCLFRESVESKLGPDEAAVPFTALMLLEGDGRPFIADWLDLHGEERWINRLLDVMLIPIWHMLVHHGIAFESHAQNLVLIHVQGWPQKIVLRDFHEDTEYVPDYLSRPELEPDFAEVEPLWRVMADDDGYRMRSTSALRELFMDTVYVYNLAELSFVLARHCGFDEARFWNLVAVHLRRYAESGVTEVARIERLGCDAPTIAVESLLKKKFMNGDVLDFFEHTVVNPLAKC